MRLIDADKLKELYQEYKGYTHSEVILQNIDDQPTVYIDLHKYAKQWNNTRTGRISYKFIEWATDKLNNKDKKWFEKRLTYRDEDSIAKYNRIERVYEILVATYNTKDIEKEDALIAIGEAIGYLGEVLD